MIDLFEAVMKSAVATDSKYRDICQCRDDLLGFLTVMNGSGKRLSGRMDMYL